MKKDNATILFALGREKSAIQFWHLFSPGTFSPSDKSTSISSPNAARRFRSDRYFSTVSRMERVNRLDQLKFFDIAAAVAMGSAAGLVELVYFYSTFWETSDYFELAT
jgi:hypothetical protein